MAGRRRGPASKLTPKLRNELCVYLEKGHTINGACGLVGIHKSTYFDWVDRGNGARTLQQQERPVPADEKPYLDFANAVDLARDHGEGWLLEQLFDAADPTANDKHLKRWQAYMTVLERSRPDRWRRRAAAEYMRDRDAPPQVLTFDPEKLSLDELKQLEVLMTKAAPTEE